jgi:bifunctional DNA-binding transcriptional regulator/antitoxin component of YhaV-PrlF toxin-antitoxin module
MRIVTMSKDGRITLPMETRRALGLNDEAELEIEVDAAQDAIVLRPAVVLRREDAWAYTSEHRALLRSAHEDSRAGRVQQLTEEDLARLGEQ